MNPQSAIVLKSTRNQVPNRCFAIVEKVFRENNQSLLSFLRKRLPTLQDAKEVAQEAYVRLLQLEQPEGIESPRAYLFKTAEHIATDRTRHLAIVRSTEAHECHMASNAPSPVERLSARQELEIVLAALDELSPKCREVFLQRRIGDLRTDAIAQQSGIGGRMVRLYVKRATRHCYRSLQKAHAVRGDAEGHHHEAGIVKTSREY